MKKWTMPSNYFGAEWPEYYIFLTTHRDADALTASNFRVALKRLKAIPEPAGWLHDTAPVLAVRENHWAVGWVEWIAIHEDAKSALELARDMEKRISNYPVLDDDDFSELEHEEEI